MSDAEVTTTDASVRDLFVRSFGIAPEGTWSAPGRVNFIGEHTDYNDGLVLPFAIGARAHVAIARTTTGLVEVISAQQNDDVRIRHLTDLSPESASTQGWTSYIHGVLWALRDRIDLRGLLVAVDSTVPPGAGLSSSAALECATTLALRDLWSLPLDGLEVARISQIAESSYVGMPCGLMDQMASALSSAGSFTFFDTRDETVTAIPVDLDAAGLRLLLIDTRVKHSLIDGEYGDRRRECEAAAEELGVPSLREVSVNDLERAATVLSSDLLLRRARHVVTENARVQSAVELINNGDITATGPLLTASHTSLRDDFEVSTPELDVAAAAAITGGALGARVTGGGFGGSVLALVPTAAVGSCADVVREAFASRGFRPPSSWCVHPAAGAHRDS